MNSLNEYYQAIETQNVFAHHHFSSSLKRIQNEAEGETEKEKLYTELLAMDFMLNEGKLIGMFQTVSEQGDTIYEYPSSKDIKPEMIHYLFQRIKETTNFSAKARYAQVIVNCADKTNAGKAIPLLVDAYIGFIQQLLSQPFVAGERCYMIRSAFENLYPHVLKSRYRYEEINELFKKLVFDDAALSPTFRVSMINYLFEQRKHFPKETLVNCLSICERIYSTPEGKEIRVLEDLWTVTGSLIRSVSGDATIWQSRLAEAYEKQIDEVSHDTSGMAAMDSCKRAIEKYRLAKNEIKVKELSIKYTDLRKKLKLSKVETNFEVNELNKHFNHFKTCFKKLLKEKSSMEIIEFIINAPQLFPQVSLLKKRGKDRQRDFTDYIRLLKADSNKNFSKEIITKEEHELNKLYESYHFDIQLYINHQLLLIFYLGYTYDRINYHTIIGFLKERSWIGKNLSRVDSGGDTITYNWLSLLGPALYELFFGFEGYFKKIKGHMNIVLPLDSLTLKFEGLLRDFARIAGAQTIINAKGNIREMYIEELLDTEEVQKFFSEDDLMLFRYIFVSRLGLNLRNQIAHCFYGYNQYSLDKVLLVLMAILKLGKYTINVSEPVA